MKSRMKMFGIIFLVFTFTLSPCYVYASPVEERMEEENVGEDNAEDEEREGEWSEDVYTEEAEYIADEEEKTEAEDTVEGELPVADEQISAQSETYLGYAADDSGNVANVVVFVDFADTMHEHIAAGSGGRCYLKNPNLTELFQGDDAHPRAMKKYLQNISYNQLEVANIFPQYDAATDTIHPYILKNSLDYYADNKNGNTEIIEEIADILAVSNQISSNISLDRNRDGYVDNLMIIVPCESGNTNKKFYGHKASYYGQKMINSKALSNYTLVPESSSYMSASSGVLIHEFLHTMGYPDLYIVNDTDQTRSPVGTWDIMSSAGRYVQYPLAYLRSAYTNWFNIPTVTSSEKGYSLYAVSSATLETKDRQAVILKTDYSSTEFFVLEYRKAGSIFDANSNRTEDYDCLLPGSGLVIYRVNTAISQGNAQAPPYMLYVYRPGDTYENGYEKAEKALLDYSFLSAESGRTSFGSSDVQATISDNAIAYSDGTNSGIVISNVGSISGDQITFDITFTEADEKLKWKLESEDTTELTLRTLDSDRDDNGALYCIAQTNASGISALLKYDAGNWQKIADGPKGNGHKIAVYNGEVYILYLDSTFHVRLDKLDRSRWNNLFTSSECSNEIMMEKADDGIYFTYCNANGDTIYAYKYSDNLKKLGDKVCYSQSGYPSNPVISSQNGSTVIAYREAFNNNRIYVKKYDEKLDTWSALLGGTMQANNAFIKQKGNLLYLLKNGTTFGDNQTFLYVYDMNSANPDWEQVGTDMVMDSTALEIDICFNGAWPYVVYSNGTDKTYTMTLENNSWEQLGMKVSSQSIAGLKAYYENGKLYVAYLDTLTGRVVIRSLAVIANETLEPLTGWQVISGKKYYYESGEKVYGGKKIGGYWYYFDSNGVMQSDWWRNKNGDKYYYDEQGHLVVNQGKKIGSWWYYFSTSGAMKYNWWRDKNGDKYYYDEQGHLVVNQGKKISGWWYYFSTSGAMKYNWWRDKNGDKYYYDEQGHLVVNQGKKIGSWWYYFSTSGAMKYNWWRNKNGDKYYYDGKGHLVTGRTINISGISYTFATSGKLLR